MSNMAAAVKPGDFTGLAKDYALYRPDYCPSVLNGLLGLLNRDSGTLDVVDVGAGTGIWTRMISQRGVGSLTAVEPNEDMLNTGASIEHPDGATPITWKVGHAEHTGLKSLCCDWVTMASSFHWVDFESATAEFHRILRPGGRFSALWNPRLIEVNPLLVEIEAYLQQLKPNLKRVSSGRSGITETLTSQLNECNRFTDVIYLEGRHVIRMSHDRYLGAWRSVNDLQAQLGPASFSKFMRFVEAHIHNAPEIEATYLTRAWSARKQD